jgi:hypothetical protein
MINSARLFLCVSFQCFTLRTSMTVSSLNTVCDVQLMVHRVVTLWHSCPGRWRTHVRTPPHPCARILINNVCPVRGGEQCCLSLSELRSEQEHIPHPIPACISGHRTPYHGDCCLLRDVHHCILLPTWVTRPPFLAGVALRT